METKQWTNELIEKVCVRITKAIVMQMCAVAAITITIGVWIAFVAAERFGMNIATGAVGTVLEMFAWAVLSLGIGFGLWPLNAMKRKRLEEKLSSHDLKRRVVSVRESRRMAKRRLEWRRVGIALSVVGGLVIFWTIVLQGGIALNVMRSVMSFALAGICFAQSWVYDVFGEASGTET